MYRFGKFFEGIQQDLKVYIYWCIVFTLFRFAFICIYSSQIEGLFTTDVLQAMWLGLRMSLKTTGVLVLGGAMLSTLPSMFFKNCRVDKIRYFWHALALYLFSVLFFARIPYYQIFNNAFDMMVINGMHDDVYAILMTAINEYQMILRLAASIVVGVILTKILDFILKTPIVQFNSIEAKKITIIVTAFLVPILWIFTRYGGSFTSGGSIGWESAARTKYHLLNEAILDDGQALYRVNHMRKKLKEVQNVNISIEDLKNEIEFIGGNPAAKSIDNAFMRSISKPRINRQPRNVFLVIGESFGWWPFMEQFQHLGLVEETNKLKNSNNGYYIENMLSGGDGTMSALNVLLTGLPYVGLYENYQDNSFKIKFQMGIGYIMKKMGYKTVFWYGGFGGWQNLKNMVLSQSFDEFHCADEFKYTGGNSWGCPDEVLFKEVSKYVELQSDEKVFHIILTTSNHPPYTIDVENEGFNRNDVIAKLPAEIKNERIKINQLGHIWYTDKVIGGFIKHTEKAYPDSLFVIIGDHSERFSFDKKQTLKTNSAIPCIFYGKEINKKLFEGVNIGVHNQLAGTIAELIGPIGFEYSAIFKSMFNENLVYNHYLSADDYEIKLLKDNQNLFDKASSAKKIAAWRVLKGNCLSYE